MKQFEIIWHDHKLEPTCVPDLRYPNGIDLDVSCGQKNCATPLPYPAKRCGHYEIRCLKCGTHIICTTAGRIDDPRSIKIPCSKV